MIAIFMFIHHLRRLLLVSICLLTAFISLSQSAQVIAPNGLRLRSAPRKDAPIKASIPFGQTVRWADEKIYGHDTIRWVRNFGYYELLRYDEQLSGTGDFPLTGHWRKVYWNKFSGYVFDAWLWNEAPVPSCPLNKKSASTPNQAVRIFKPGFMDLMEYLDFDPRCYHWYGLYQHGQQASLRAVETDFVAGFTEWAGKGLLCLAGDHLHLKYIIGSRQPLPERTFNCSWLETQTHWPDLESDAPVQLWTHDGFGFKTTSNVRPLHLSTVELQSASGLTHSFDLEPIAAFPLALYMAGDVDGDGCDDYFILFNLHETDAFAEMLYLSTVNKTEDSWRPAAYRFIDFD